MAHLSLSFLGGFDVTLDAEVVTAFGADKARALLAYLAIDSARLHRRAELSAMFYPDLPEKKAAHNLSQNLLRLRKALREGSGVGAPFLVITPRDVQFNSFSDYQLDVARFRELLNQCSRHQHTSAANCALCMQRLAQVADLYRGDLLSGLLVPDSYAFEEWRMAQQEELREQALVALSRLAAFYEQRGEWERVLDYARRQVALEPWREEAHIQIMQALSHSGQTAAALRQFEIYQQTLEDEFVIQPSAEITAVYEQIRAGEVQRSANQPALKEGESAWLASEGERRQVTVLVCSRRAGDLGDPEELQEQMTQCERLCEGIFHRFGGRRALRQGNACLVYYGYPQAYEDAARRAVHSGLALAAASQGQADSGDLKGVTRIGIHTGLLTVGEKRGRRWQDRDLIGSTLEVARDCQRLAGPGEVLITADTRRLVQEFFDLQPLGPQQLAAAEQPGGENSNGKQYHLVRGESGAQNRLDWLAQTQRLTHFTGREAEMQQVRACYEMLLQGKGQAVLLSGEPGIGKSRVLWELQHAESKHLPAAGRPSVRWLASRCLPYFQNTGLYPLIGLLEQFLGFAAFDSLQDRCEKLGAVLARYGLDRPSTVWLLSLLLRLPTSEPAPATVTEAQRAQMSEVVMALLQRHAGEQPVVLVIEDLHWGDPSTVEWLGQAIPALAAVPCLMLFTARPTFQPAWFMDEGVRRKLLKFALQPLPPAQAEAMVANLAGERMLDEDLLQRIVAQTDGNPLFIEELTKTMLEQPIGQGTMRPGTGIPVTLLDSLAARLDRLGPAKETAQWAAVIGREFPYPVLHACAPYDDQRLQSDLARLIEAELVIPIQAAPQDAAPYMASGREKAPARYTFKHTLVQEAAYASLLNHTRHVYHQRIAETLENRFPQMAELRPEILAQHFASAGAQAKAVDYWILAGERALAQSATLEAQAFFDQALAAISGSDPENIERRWRALVGRERVFDIRVDREARQWDITAMLELAETCADDDKRAEAWLHQMRFYLQWNDYPAGLPAAEAARAAACRAGNRAAEVYALSGKLFALICLGERAAAYPVAEETLARLPEVTDEGARGYVLGNLGLYYHNTGDLSRAVQLMLQCMQSGQQQGNRYRENVADINVGWFYTQLGLFSQARATLEAGVALAEVQGLQGLLTTLTNYLGYVAWCTGDRERAITMSESALHDAQAIHYSPYVQAMCHAYLGFYREEAGEWAAAAAHLAEGQALLSRLEVNTEVIEPKAVEARCLLAMGHEVEARQRIEEVWAYLREHGTAGVFYPARVYGCIADVASGIPIPGISPCEAIEMGYRDLMARAEKISDAEWRRSFLENVRENREIVERWNKISKESAV